MKLSTSVVAFILLCFTGSAAFAGDFSNLHKKKKTTLGLYYTAQEAYDHLKSKPAKTIFIDVRDPIEINFTGMPTLANANVPFKFVDTSMWNPKKSQFNMKKNPNFVKEAEAVISKMGLGKDDTIVLMCRSGQRSAAGANALNKVGYKNVYSIVDGYEGDKAKSGPQKGQRVVNGWKNAGAPYTLKVDVAKIYGNPTLMKPKK